nr:iron ABC transporter permease [Clostridia bacterium]
SAVTAAFVCIGIGSVGFSPGEVLRAVFVDDNSTARMIVYELRLPRVICCGLVGICLALSGCILQAVMRNGMASPSTIGVTGGAGFLGYLTLAVFPSLAPVLPMASIAGAFVTTMLIYLLAYKGGVSPMRMILSGMAVSALFGALNDAIRTFFADSLGNASGFLVGGFNGCTWESVHLILPYAAAGAVICVFIPQKMNILMLGDETASSLGLNYELFRFVLIALSSLLSGAAIAVCGLIGFVGLIVPHTARLIVGSDSRFLLPASACLGALLLTVCDTAGRVIMPPGEIPVSIILSLIGAPFFLFLLRGRRYGGEG